MKSTRKVIASRRADGVLTLLLECGCQKRARFDRAPDRTNCYNCPPKGLRPHSWYPWRTMPVGDTFQILVKSARTMVAHATNNYHPKIFKINGTTVTRVK